MRATDTRRIEGEKLTPISWRDARKIMRPKAEDDQYYLTAVYVFSGAWFFDAIQQRSENLTAVCTLWRGHPFVVAAIRKDDLPPDKYSELVRSYFGISGARIEDRCVDVWAPVWAMELCREMTVSLLTDLPADKDLAMEY